jgi:hypothetical protein
VWTAWSHHGEAGDMAWFDLHHGNVVVKNPDREIRRKMWRLAERLRAKVQGDDREYYDRFGNPTDDASKAPAFLSALVRHLSATLSGIGRAEISGLRRSHDFRSTILSSRGHRTRLLKAV